LLGQLFPQPDDRSTVLALVALGEVFERRDRGSNAASPSTR
jgi:hypothetical protein